MADNTASHLCEKIKQKQAPTLFCQAREAIVFKNSSTGNTVHYASAPGLSRWKCLCIERWALMKLENPRLSNFQSFGSKPTTLSLEDITYLIGSNGSDLHISCNKKSWWQMDTLLERLNGLATQEIQCG